jgi:hypothetical protein
MWAICDVGYVIDFLFHSLGKVFGKFLFTKDSLLVHTLYTNFWV